MLPPGEMLTQTGRSSSTGSTAASGIASVEIRYLMATSTPTGAAVHPQPSHAPVGREIDGKYRTR